MKQRAISGSILLAILIPIVIIGGIPFLALATLFVGFGIKEMLRVFSKETKISTVSIVILTLLTFVVFFTTIHFFGERVRARNSTSLISGVILILFSLSVFDKKFDANEVSKGLILISYVGIGFASIYLSREIHILVITYLVLVGFSTDIFAYFTGRLIGKRKLAPHISPKKTLEGAIGGTVIATILGTVFGILFEVDEILLKFISRSLVSANSNLLFIITLSISISILSQIGDLAASRIKRQYGSKDFGNLIPGHGGILDRFDSILFSALGMIWYTSILSKVLN